MCDKIMVIGVPDHARQNPAAKTLVLTGLQQVMPHEQLIHRGRRFHEISRNLCVKDRLCLIACLEMPGMSQFMRQCEHIRHLVVPAQQDVGIFPIGARAEATRRFSLIPGKVHPSLAAGCPYHIHIIFPENRQSLLYVFL